MDGYITACSRVLCLRRRSMLRWASLQAHCEIVSRASHQGASCRFAYCRFRKVYQSKDESGNTLRSEHSVPDGDCGK